MVQHFFVLRVEQLGLLLLFWLLVSTVDQAQDIKAVPLEPYLLPVEVLVQLLLVLFDHLTPTVNLLQH